MNKFKHSGAFGDLIYSLPIVKHFGGGEFYLHLNQIDWIGSYYYNSPPNPFHQGRLTKEDFGFMKSFMEAQSYIAKFDIMQPQTEITHNLDRFRPEFVNHPGNYVDIYSSVFNITDVDLVNSIRNTPWLTVPEPITIKDRPVVINRTSRWTPHQLPSQWKEWKNMDMENQAVFVGLEKEYQEFKSTMGWDIPHYVTENMLDLAQVIAGSKMFIGNQSVALSLAIGLGVDVCCEHRTDLPLERNECFGFNPVKTKYFIR
jgi:hypothetical protein